MAAGESKLNDSPGSEGFSPGNLDFLPPEKATFTNCKLTCIIRHFA